MKSFKQFDTIIVPAHEAGFLKEFINNKRWFAIRIGTSNIDKIQYIATYRAKPLSAITHYAKVDKIEKYDGDNEYGKIKNGRRYILFISDVIEINHVKLADALPPQSPRYTSLNELLKAKKLSDLYPNKSTAIGH